MLTLPALQPFNVLRYQTGQHYDSHYDVFEPESYGPQASQRVRPPCLHIYLKAQTGGCGRMRWHPNTCR